MYRDSGSAIVMALPECLPGVLTMPQSIQGPTNDMFMNACWYKITVVSTTTANNKGKHWICIEILIVIENLMLSNDEYDSKGLSCSCKLESKYRRQTGEWSRAASRGVYSPSP